jgi:hypothetical protein
VKRRVDEVLLEVEHERQRARLYDHARRQLARRFLGEAPKGEEPVHIDVLAAVMEEMLIAASGANQKAQRLLARRLSFGR